MKQLNHFIELIRLKKPIGFMLLFWPCAWGLTIAYDSSNNIFVQPRPNDMYGNPCASWTVNTTTGMYNPPITRPTGDGDSTSVSTYKWDEAAYQADNTKGWIQIDS